MVEACGHHVFRYKVVNGVVYSDHSHANNTALKNYRDAFLEMLLTSIWLYKSFPDVDLWASFSDEPSHCSLDVPILHYSLLHANVTRAARTSNVGYIGGVPFSISQLLTAGGGAYPSLSQKPAPKFTRGWAMNWPVVWAKLSYLPNALKQYQTCLQTEAGGKASIAKLFWRGSNTGALRGRAHMSGPLAKVLEHPWGPALINKRMALALLARYHPDTMDVGLHEVLPELLPPGKTGLTNVQKAMRRF
jgi:hypothetical protein